MMDRRGIVGILNSSEVLLEEKINYCSAYLRSSPSTSPDAELLLHYSLLLGQQAEMQYQQDKQWSFPVLNKAILSLNKIPETYENYESLVRPYMVQLYCTAADATDKQSQKVVLLRQGLSKAKDKPPLGILLRLMSLPPSEQWPVSRIHDSARVIIVHYPDSLEADYARITVLMDPAFQDQLSSLASDYRLQELAAGYQDISREPGDVNAYNNARVHLMYSFEISKLNDDPAVKANLKGAFEANLKQARAYLLNSLFSREVNEDPADKTTLNSVLEGAFYYARTDSSLLEKICGMFKNFCDEFTGTDICYKYLPSTPELNDPEIVLKSFQSLFLTQNYSWIVGPEYSLPIPKLLHSPELSVQLEAQMPSLRAAYLFSLYKQGQEIPSKLVKLDDPLCKLVVDLARGKRKRRLLRWSSLARKANFGYDPLKLNPDLSNGLLERVQQELK